MSSGAPNVSRRRAERQAEGEKSQPATLTTLVPARLERLPWGRFHVLVIFALGVTWILDGLEVTLSGSVGAALKTTPALKFTDQDVGAAGSAYLIGAVVGALFFGWLTDRLGRKRLFFTTIAVYLTATALTGLAWSPWSFFLFRFLTGAGIGGEYAAINSTIQELIPARFRGQLDLTINGSFWVGAALGAVVAAVSTRPRPPWPGAGLALRFSVWRRPWPGCFRHAHVDPGKPEVAGDPRPCARGGQDGRHRSNSDSPRKGSASRRSPIARGSGCSRAAIRRSQKSSIRCSAATRPEPRSGSC